MDDKHRKVLNLKMGYERKLKKKKGNLEKSHAVFQSGQREHYQIWEGRQTKEQAGRQGGREEEGKRGGEYSVATQAAVQNKTDGQRGPNTVTFPDAD